MTTTPTPVPPLAVPTGRGGRAVLAGVGVALGAVVLAPVLLSGQDLYRWGAAPRGLGLTGPWPLLVPLALDLAALVCIGGTILAALRRERPGVFEVLVWTFAGVSALAQYRHGAAEAEAGRAQDGWWAFPALALLGPLLLHVVLGRLRRWARADSGEQHAGAAGFGARWLPGVAFRETARAWAASRREGIGGWREAVAHVRERDAVAGVDPVEAVRYAVDVTGTYERSALRAWLVARGVRVTADDLDAALGERPVSPLDVEPVSPAGPSVDADPVGPDLGTMTRADRLRHAFAVLGSYDVPPARAWLAARGVEAPDSSSSYKIARAEADRRRGEMRAVVGGAR